MSTVTFKEKNMLMITLVLVLYGVAALCYRGQRANWEKQERIYKNARIKYVEECDLIAATDEWNAKYQEMRALMPVFPYDKDVDTHWLNVMDTVASENSFSISRRQTGKEEEVGDVYELPIECKNWEGTLESLVTFLYGLHKQGAMVDVRQLYVRPAAPGYLKGTFSLYCAYMRGEVVEGNGAAAAPASVEQVELPETSIEKSSDSVSSEASIEPSMTPVEEIEEVPGVESPLDAPAESRARELKRSGLDNGLDEPQPEVNEEDVVKEALKALSGK